MYPQRKTRIDSFRLCTKIGCAKKHYAKDLCRYHWNLSRREPKPFRLTDTEKPWYKELKKYHINNINIAKDSINAILQQANINERQIKVLTLRFGLDGNGTHDLRYVAQLYGVTRERIKQIEEVAIRKIRETAIKMGEKCF